MASPTVGAILPIPLGPALAGAFAVLGTLLWRVADPQPWMDRLHALAATDLFEGRRWSITLAVYLLLRIPLLVDASYGADPDAWRMVSSGTTLWFEQSYQASRLPGYPVPELLLSPFVAFAGPQLSKLAVAAVGFALLYAFDRLGRALGAAGMGLATLALATSPAFLVQSTSVVETVFTLGGLLAALLAVHRGQVFHGAGWIGVAFASRVTSGLYAPVALLWARARGLPWLRVGQLALFAAQAGAILFIPVLARYRAEFLELPGAEPSLELATSSVLGALGLAPLLSLGLLLGERVRPPPSAVPWVDRAGLAALAAVGLALFALLPHEPGNLLPPLVLLLLLAASVARPISLLVLALAGLLSIGLDTQPGSVRAELSSRAQQLDAMAEVMAAPVDPGALVLLGSATYAALNASTSRLVPFEEPGPWKRVLHDPETDVRYVAHMPRRLFDQAQTEGRSIYIWSPGEDSFTSNNFGYSPLQSGAILLHGRSETDKERRRKEGWIPRPREAASQITVTGKRVEIQGWSNGAVRACLEPATPVDGARRATGRWSLKGGAERGGFKLQVIWQREGDDRVGVTNVVADRSTVPEAPFDVPLTPPEGATSALLCLSLEGAALSAMLKDAGFER